MKFMCKLIPKISENKMKYKGRNIAVFLYSRNIPHIFLFSKIRIYIYIYTHSYSYTYGKYSLQLGKLLLNASIDQD